MTESEPRGELEATKRRSTRIVQAVPLTVTGVDALGRPFQERTSTLIINCHGCRYQSKHYVLKNMWVTLEVPHPEAGREPRSIRARVTWIQRPRTVRELFQIGVELEVAGNFWGIAFPPEDWFPFPETPVAAVLAPSTPDDMATVAAEPALPAAVPREDNVHVFPSPGAGAGEGSLALARQMARLMVEARQQVQNAVREATIKTVAAETHPLLAQIHSQFKEAAEKSVQAATASHLEEAVRQLTAKIDEARQAGSETLREEWSREVERRIEESGRQLTERLAQMAEAQRAAFDRHVEANVGQALESLKKLSEEVGASVARAGEARQSGAPALREEWSQETERRVHEAGQRLAAHLAQIEEAQRVVFEQRLEAGVSSTLEKLKKLGGELGATTEAAEASVTRLRQEVSEATETASRQWQQTLKSQAEEARTRLEKIEKTVRQLSDEMAAATSAAQATWRGRLEADLAAAATHWNQKVESSLETAVRQAAERLGQQSQAATDTLEYELATRVATVRQSFERASADAEGTLGALRAALEKETEQARTSLAEIQQVAGRMEEYSTRLDALSQATAEELQRRFEAILAAQSSELNRRAESAVAGMADRLLPVLETAGQQSVGRLAAELEQQLSPHMARANELLRKLSATHGQAEETFRAHEQRLLEASEHSAQETLARLKETTGRFEKDLQEAGRAATAKWVAELDAKATDTAHTTFEALHKSSEWYEKKVQTQMQAAIEKGVEQAVNGLREKAGEVSGLFATELDHYSRSYVEHTQGQMDEAVREAVERARGQLNQAVETTAASFSDDAHRTAQEEFKRLTASAASLVEQNAAQLEAHAAEVRSKSDAEARQFFVDFHKGMTQEIQQGVAQARHELETQFAPVKDAWRAERESQEQQLRENVERLNDESIEEFKKRLENVSNSWLVTTVTTLSQQSQDMIGSLADTAERKLRTTCSEVFAGVGESLRQRLLELSASLGTSTPPEPEEK